MYLFGRTLQLLGLAIPPLTMAAQLSDHISAGQMLQFLVLSAGVFFVGHKLQQFSGSGR